MSFSFDLDALMSDVKREEANKMVSGAITPTQYENKINDPFGVGAELGLTTAKAEPAPVTDSFAGDRAAIEEYVKQLSAMTAPTITAPTVTPTTLAKTTLDWSKADETRKQQQALIDQLTGRATGKTPSVAEMQYKAAQDEAIKQQFGLAKATRSPLAIRSAMLQKAEQDQQMARQAGILRLQEQEGAQKELGAQLGTLGQQDITRASIGGDLASRESIAEAGLSQGDKALQAQLTAQAEQATAAAKLDLERLKQSGILQARGMTIGLTQQDITNALEERRLMLQKYLGELDSETAKKVAQMEADAKTRGSWLQGLTGFASAGLGLLGGGFLKGK